MIARQFAQLALGALLMGLGACTPPAPVVDEERLARRVAELLAEQYGAEGVCAGPGGSRRSRGDGDGGVQDPTLADEEPSEDPETPQGPPSAETLAQLQRAMAEAAPPAEVEYVSAFSLAESTLPATMTPVATGDQLHRRTCVPEAGSPASGPATAKVVIVAFVDPECPFSARLFSSILAQRTRLPDDVRVVWKNMIMSHHARAPRAAETLRMVFERHGADPFVAALGRVYANIRALALSDLEQLVANDAIPPLELRASLRERRYAIPVAQEVLQSTAAHALGSPTLFVNGRLVTGAVPLDVLGRIVDEELSRARALARRNPSNSLSSVLCRADQSLTTDGPTRPLAERRAVRQP